MAGAGDDPRNAKGVMLIPSDDFCPLDAREHQVRSPVWMGDTGPHETDGRDAMDGVYGRIWIDSVKCVPDAEHAIPLEDVSQHLPIPHLEDE